MNKELKKSIEQAQIHWLTQRLEEYQELEVKYNNLKEEQIRDEVIRNIDEIVQKAIEIKYRDEEMRILQTIIKELQKELDKKDKVIKLMINWIGDRCFYSDDYGNSCEIIQDSCFNPIKDCEKCIKEYFYKKVEEEDVKD